MLRSLLPVLFALAIVPATAQINDVIHVTPEDLAAMSQRTLLVVLEEEDPKVIEEMPKKNREEEIARYKAAIANYNALIEPAVRKYWTFNPKIEVKKASEVVPLFAAKSPDYVVLMKVALRDMELYYNFDSGLRVPVLMYQRTDEESKVNKKGFLTISEVDYQMYIPSSFIDDKGNTEADLKFALVQMQRNMRWIMETKQVKNFEDYGAIVAAGNCARLKDKSLVLPAGQLWKDMPEAEAKASYGGTLEVADPAMRDEMYLKATEGKALLFQMPYGLLNQSGLTVMTYSNVVYLKVVVDAKTDEILGLLEVKGMMTPQNYGYRVNEKNLENLKECKF